MGGALAAAVLSRPWLRLQVQMVPSAFLLAVVLSLAAARSMCPPQCLCQDDALAATCTSAKLTVFPIQLNPDVKHIDLSDNKISSVDYTLTFYINLLHLDLSHNKIHSLGSHNFDRQENLTFLNISFNQIIQLGKGTFKGLKDLKLLDLRNNSIESVDGSAFKDTVELEVLNFSNNKITSFEDPLVFKNLRKLKLLYLDGNQILDVPSQVLLNLPYSSIETLNLSNNLIDTIDDSSFPSPVMGSLRTLLLASNAVSGVHKSSFNSLHSLTLLDLSDNNLTAVPTEQLSKLSQLIELNLSDNMFTELPAVAFQSLFHLKILYLSRMPRLSRLESRAFVDNIHLESVIMDDNREVKMLPARIFHGNIHLRHVSIRRNSLSIVDASHFPLDSLESLDLSDNPLECNCSLLWLWKLARHEAAQVEPLPSNDTLVEDDKPLRLSTTRLRCAAPPPLRGILLNDAPDSAVRCETTWFTVAVVTAFVLALFVATCVVLLLIGDRSILACRRSKDTTPLGGDSKRPAATLHATPPVIMLMPEKHFPPDSVCRTPTALRCLYRRSMSVSLAVGFCIYLSAVLTSAKLYGKDPKYSNVWVAKIEGGEETAQRVAKDLGFSYMGKCGQFEDYYEMSREDHPHVSTRGSDHLTSSLLDIDEVKWVKQQKLVKPVTDIIKSSKGATQVIEESIINTQSREFSTNDLYGNNILERIRYSLYNKRKLAVLTQGDRSKLGTFPTMLDPGLQVPKYRGATMNSGQYTGKTSAYANLYNDPSWKYQWYLQDYRTTDMPVMDLNVVPVHKIGYTGKGVTVAVVDSGVYDNPDVAPNVNHDLGYDFCKDAKKKTEEDKENNNDDKEFHGTNCAAVIAMVPNNGICGVGIAYNVSIVGMRAVCPNLITESTEGKALIHNLEEVDIYTNSWGFSTEGKYVEKLDELIALAYQEGTTKGRKKKGSIYLQTAGNDKDIGDNCGHDGTNNQPYVITITGANQWGNPTSYCERCTAILASTYTMDVGNEGIVVADGDHGCTNDFAGTSAACPQAAAIVALTLEANPELTYRDVMHLITMSAEVAPLADNKKTWYQNGRGFWVSNDFGFGLMNAQNMVTLAKGWQNVHKKRTCIVTVKLDVPKPINVDEKVKVPFNTTGCEGSETDEVNYLEHVELASIVTYPYRGLISVFLTSPSGTRSNIFECRLKDDDQDGLEGWPTMSTHNWGELTKGLWIVEYRICRGLSMAVVGLVKEFTVKFHGTKEMPTHYKKRRQYAAFRTPEGNTNRST